MSTIARFVVSRSGASDPERQDFWSHNRYSTLDKATLFRDVGEALRSCEDGDVVMQVEVTLTAVDPHAHLTVEQREKLVAMLAQMITADRSCGKTTDESVDLMRSAGFGEAVITEARAQWAAGHKVAA